MELNGVSTEPGEAAGPVPGAKAGAGPCGSEQTPGPVDPANGIAEAGAPNAGAGVGVPKAGARSPKAEAGPTVEVVPRGVGARKAEDGVGATGGEEKGRGGQEVADGRKEM